MRHRQEREEFARLHGGAHTQTVAELFETLKNHPHVTGLIRYGADHAEEGYRVGDVDLFVVLTGWEPQVESLHFDVATTPVDLNLITLRTFQELPPAFTFPQLALRDGTILLDKAGEVSRALRGLRERFSSVQPETLSAHDVAFMRHGHRHLLDKLRGRLETEPVLANLLLGTNVHWLIQSYLRLRGLPFLGERHALLHVREHDTDMYALLEAFYSAVTLAEKLALTERLTAHVLEPVGGAWQRGEVLAFDTEGNAEGEAEPLASRRLSAYRELFGEEVPSR